jgi:hypothetical protein
VITHEESLHLLAAFALDAVQSDEHEEIEAHLGVCPRCRAELDAHREVASGLGTILEPLPEALWSSISSRLSSRGDQDPPVRPTLLRDVRPDLTVNERPLPSAWGFPRGRLATVASIALGAAAVATVLGITLISTDNRVAQLEGAVRETAHTEVVAALETPGHRVVNLDTAADRRLAQFVVLRNGRGYLVTSNLPPLSAKETYQLWGVVNGQTISLGLLGRSPHLATFTLAGSSRPFGLGVTVEQAGGSVSPSGFMLASGTV